MVYDDENELELESGNSLKNDCILTRKDFEDLASYYIRTFFRNKVDEYGAEIDPEELLTERNISLVLNMSICDGMPAIYKALKTKKDANRKGKIPDDVQLVLKLLNDCSKLSIPKTAATGLISVYVEVCKGCTVNVDL